MTTTRTDAQLPPVPQFRLKQIFDLCNQLALNIGVRVYYDTLTGADYAHFVESVRRQLPNVRSYLAVDESCREILGVSLTPERFKALIWRLVGNLQRLQHGYPVPSWSVQRAQEWVPVQILKVWPSRDFRRRAGHLCSMQVLAGSACTETIQKFWTRETCGFMASRLGFSRSYGKRPYQSALLLTGLRMCVLLEPELSRESPAFRHVDVPGFCRKHNIELLRARLQRRPPCPNGFTHPCYKCAVGYTECPFGTHRDTFVQQHCQACDKPDALFDTEMSANICRKCFIRQLLQEQ